MEIIDLNAVKQSAALASAVAALDNKILALTGQDDTDSVLTVARLTGERGKLLRQLATARKSEKREAAAEKDDAQDTAELFDILRTEIRDWLDENDYRYVHSDSTFWLYRPATNVWIPTPRTSLNNHNPRLANGEYFNAFIQVLRDDGRWFDRQTVTFADVPSGTLNRLQWQFLKPSSDQPHHWFFDTLISSITGGKAENIRHFERLILAKWQNPANYLLPTLVISDSGGTGKTLLAEMLLPTIFDGLVSPNVAMTDLTGRFNGQMSGKAIWFVNETVADKTDHEALLRILGSKTIRSERKGKDATEVDNTALTMIVGNGALGTVKLSGSEVDRRFSVMTNNRPLKEVVAERLGCSIEAGNEWVQATGQFIIRDPIEAARWLQSLIDRHGEVGFVAPLHGEDFATMIERQTDLATEVIRAFIDGPQMAADGAYFNRALMFEAYVAAAKADNLKAQWSRPRFAVKAEEMIARAGLETRKVKWVTAAGTTTANVVHRGEGCPARLTQNDDAFCRTDDFGRTIWTLELDR